MAALHGQTIQSENGFYLYAHVHYRISVFATFNAPIQNMTLLNYLFLCKSNTIVFPATFYITYIKFAKYEVP